MALQGLQSPRDLPSAAMKSSQLLEEGECCSSAAPLRKYACNVEDYHSLEQDYIQDHWHAKAKTEGRYLPQHASQAYGMATNVFAWVVFTLFVIALASRCLSVPVAVAEANLPSNITQALPAASAQALPSARAQASPAAAQVSPTIADKPHTVVARAAGPTMPPVLCEDADLQECALLLAGEDPTGPPPALGTFTPFPAACSPHAGGKAAARCPRSCGLCAVVLGDCRRATVVHDASCEEGQDVVGEVCGHDGKMTEEAYCTYLPTGSSLGEPMSFVCAHCAEEQLSPYRRSLMAQMLELRLEEDGREAGHSEEALENNADSVAERDALVVHR